MNTKRPRDIPDLTVIGVETSSCQNQCDDQKRYELISPEDSCSCHPSLCSDSMLIAICS